MTHIGSEGFAQLANHHLILWQTLHVTDNYSRHNTLSMQFFIDPLREHSSNRSKQASDVPRNALVPRSDV